MRVCDVVLNSVWYDPRVRKQIAEYIDNEIDVVCVGYRCHRYDEEKVKLLPCDTTIVDIDDKFKGKQFNLIKKLLREKNRNNKLTEAIINYNPDIIHSNDLNTLEACCNAAKILGCKLIYDSHEICTENNNSVGMYKLFNKYTEKKYISCVNKMICVSNAAADYFVNKYKISRPMVITNCSLKSDQRISDSKNSGFEVLNHGQFYSGRGYDIMLESVKYLQKYPNISVALRGFGPMEDELKKYATENGGEQIRFYPRVLVEELISEASHSHVGVAITEGICINFKLSVSNKLFEYASAGLPVIMSDIPEHRILNDKYGFGIIIPENTPESFAEAVIKLYTDNDLYNKCVLGSKMLTEEINWSDQFGKLISLERSWIDGKE